MVKRNCWWPLCDSIWLVSVTSLKNILGCLVLLTTGTRWEKERILVSSACVRWACCGRNAVVPKPPVRACKGGGMHPSPVWVSALFWWWWSFPGNGCWLMVALLVNKSWSQMPISYIDNSQTCGTKVLLLNCIITVMSEYTVLNVDVWWIYIDSNELDSNIVR